MGALLGNQQPVDPDKDPAKHGGRDAKHFKFTFQLSYWDLFKELAACKQPRRLNNMALLLAFLVRKGALLCFCVCCWGCVWLLMLRVRV